jgi:hypothetical protein
MDDGYLRRVRLNDAEALFRIDADENVEAREAPMPRQCWTTTEVARARLFLTFSGS